ncbi:MAG: glycosyltransferase [Candidatus Levybacteria bacterium]|nr:glycosyltransferase [Candidatus Levybacteria bacterium]
MKIALVHDYIKEYGGAERVLEEFIKIYPDADIYTSVYLPEYLGPHKKRFEKLKIHTSFLQYIPFSAKLISPLRLLAPLAFKSFNLSSYDVILVSQTGAYFPNLVQKGEAKLICYTHTPPRYLYGYMTARDWKSNVFKRVIGNLMNHFLRIVDYHASQNVDQFIANSNEVAGRIKKFYRKEAIVVYPPVQAHEAMPRNANSKRDYLTGGRLAQAKGTDIIIDAFLKNGQTLKVFGKGFAGFEEKLLARIKNKKTNIEFLGEVSDEEKLKLMEDAKAFVFAAFDEDFGITPVEAMGKGTPVIAFKSGGVLETVIDSKTGLFYEPNTPNELNKAIEKFEKLKINSSDCQKQALKFSPKVFDQKIKEIVGNA